ncbi:MAG: hypothetical protein AAF802_08695 [Planctomycetota bacterium]
MIGDFKTGELNELPAQKAAAMYPVAILGDDMTIVMAGNGTDGKTSKEDLQSWRVKGNSVDLGTIWKPYEGERDGTIRFAAAGSDNTLLTCSQAGHIVSWQMPSRRATWRLDMGSPPYWHTTLDQRRLAVASRTKLVVVDLPDGNVVASQSLEDLGSIYYPKLSFNPSEDKLYLSSIGRVLILDLIANRWVTDTEVRGVGTSNGAIFCDDQYVLIDGRTLVDWTTGGTADQYSGLGAPLLAGRFSFVVSDNQFRALDLPDDLTTANLKTAESVSSKNSSAMEAETLSIVGQWQINAEDKYATGNVGKMRSTYSFREDGTYGTYATLTMVDGGTGKQLYSVTSHQEGTWTREGDNLCLTEKQSKLVSFKSSTRQATRKQFEDAISMKNPPAYYTISAITETSLKLLDAQGSVMPLIRLDPDRTKTRTTIGQ